MQKLFYGLVYVSLLGILTLILFSCGPGFSCSPGVNTIPPVVSEVAATSSTGVRVTFDKAVLESSAENAGNYTVSGLTISGAELAPYPDLKSVGLTTSSQTPGRLYSMTIANVENLFGDKMTTTTTTFCGYASDSAPPTFNGLISATATGSSTVLLTWEAASDNGTSASDMEYLIFYNTGTAIVGHWEVYHETTIEVTSYTVTGLSPSTTYCFGVRAIDLANNQDDNRRGIVATTEAEITDTTAPTVSITALTPDPTTDNTPTLSGRATDEASNISAVQYRVDGGSWTSAEASDGAFNSSSEAYTFTTSTLSDGIHTVEVRASDSLGNTTASSGYARDTFTVDATAPTIISVSPLNGATGVATTSAVSATFSEAMNSSTITTSRFTLSSTLEVVSANLNYDSASKTATLTPSSNLSYNTTYTAGISAGVEDLAGNHMSSAYTWSFTTTIETTPTPFTFEARVKASDASAGDIKNWDTNSPPQSLAVYGNNVYVVWSDDREGENNIYFAKSTDNGATFGSPIKVNSTSGSGQDHWMPAMTLDSSGNIYVAWTRSGGSVNTYFFAKSTNGGTSFTDNVDVINNQGPSVVGSSCGPSIAVSSGGESIYIVARANDRGGGTGDVVLFKSTNGGSSFSVINNNIAGDSGSQEEWRPSVYLDSSGNVYVVWHADPNTDNNNDIYFSKSTNQGSSFSSALKVNSTSGNNRHPALAFGQGNYAGEIYVIWETDVNSSVNDVYFAKSADGSSFGSAVQVNDDSSGYKRYADMAVDSNGVINAAWEDSRGSGDKPKLYFSRSSDGGTNWQIAAGDTDDRDVDPSPLTGHDSVNIAVDSGNKVHVSWRYSDGSSIYMVRSNQ